jgi:tetratricopeptide (TPR) repeat protein
VIQPDTALPHRVRQFGRHVPRLLKFFIAACFLMVQVLVLCQSHDEIKRACAIPAQASYPGLGGCAAASHYGQNSPMFLAAAYLDADHSSRSNSGNAGLVVTGPSLNENQKRCAGSFENSNRRISACTALILAAQNNLEDLAAAYIDRGNGYQDSGEYDRAIQDYDQAIDLAPDSALAYYDRANAYDSKGEYDRAIADYDLVIQLAPEGDHVYYAYYGRGYAYSAKGEYDRAIKDYDRAIRLNSKDANLFIVRGVANFLRANPSQAVIDLRRSSKLNPTNAYSVLWLHVARRRLGLDDSKQLVKQSAKADLSKWPWPILKFYLGKVTADQMIGAVTSPDVKAENSRICEANFFAGEDALLNRHDTPARLLLQTALDVCPIRNFHHDAAAAELRRLNDIAAPAGSVSSLK